LRGNTSKTLPHYDRKIGDQNGFNASIVPLGRSYFVLERLMQVTESLRTELSFLLLECDGGT
jgi:hypothetical protein